MTRSRNLPLLLCLLGASLHLTSCTKSSLNSVQGHDATIQILIDQVEIWKNASSGVSNRPFVSLSMAQSLDAKIAVYLDGDNNRTSTNYPLSGPESLLLTHALRSIHDGILIGGRTLSIDNPRLSNRLWNSQSTGLPHQPRPIVLDSKLRHVRECLTNGPLKAKNAIVCCSHEAAALSCDIIPENDASITLLPCAIGANGQLDLKNVLIQLRNEYGIESLMVEGGSAILSSFVEEDLVDCVCITIAPKILGPRGLPAFVLGPAYGSNHDCLSLREFGNTMCVSMGKDCIVLARKGIHSSD